MLLRKNYINISNIHRRAGFTIVELLIVIVVLAILASVTVVGYSGIQQRAQVSIAKSNLKSLGTTVELYRAQNSSYPNTDAELLDALGQHPDALNLGITNTGSIASDAPNSYMYCYSEDGLNMWIVAAKPVSTGTLPIPTGTPVYYWEGVGGLGEAEYNEVDGSAGLSLCSAASAGNIYDYVWSYSPRVQL